uniref:Uncharacterized protein n=1 Tax=Arundo donax TaxID=35708 RepID=A0A0A9G0R2_ARUDO
MVLTSRSIGIRNLHIQNYPIDSVNQNFMFTKI